MALLLLLKIFVLAKFLILSNTNQRKFLFFHFMATMAVKDFESTNTCVINAIKLGHCVNRPIPINILKFTLGYEKSSRGSVMNNTFLLFYSQSLADIYEF